VIFEPLGFIARLAALVPRPRVNFTRFHGEFSPNGKHRVQVTPIPLKMLLPRRKASETVTQWSWTN